MSRVPLVIRQLWDDHRTVLFWFWVIVVAAFALVGVILGVTGVRMSVWTLAAYGAPRYFLGVLGILFAVLQLRVYVAHGITRGEFARGALAFSALVSAGSAAIIVAGYAVERPLYAAFDLLGSLEDPYPVNSVGDGAVALVMYTLAFLAYMLSGALIGVGYQRFSVLGGTLFIPAALLPGLVTDTVFTSGWFGRGFETAWGAPGLPLAFAAAALVIALGIIGGQRLLRVAPVLRTR